MIMDSMQNLLMPKEITMILFKFDIRSLLPGVSSGLEMNTIQEFAA